MIVEASVTGIFRTILIIVGTLALLRFLGRIMIAKRNLEEERSILKAKRKQEKELEKIKKRFGKTDIVNDNSNSNHLKINPNKVEDVDFEEIP
jgi:uncharacterized membrane protein